MIVLFESESNECCLEVTFLLILNLLNAVQCLHESAMDGRLAILITDLFLFLQLAFFQDLRRDRSWLIGKSECSIFENLTDREGFIIFTVAKKERIVSLKSYWGSQAQLALNFSWALHYQFGLLDLVLKVFNHCQALNRCLGLNTSLVHHS